MTLTSRRVDRAKLLLDGPRAACHLATRMERRLSLNEHDMTLLFRYRIVANALWYDVHVTFFQLNGIRLQLNAQFALQDEEQFVFVVVRVPCQTSVDLRNLDIRVVNLGHYSW